MAKIVSMAGDYISPSMALTEPAVKKINKFLTLNCCWVTLYPSGLKNSKTKGMMSLQQKL